MKRTSAGHESSAPRMKPCTTGGAYLNFLGEEGEDRVRAAFGPETYARLQALKIATTRRTSSG